MLTARCGGDRNPRRGPRGPCGASVRCSRAPASARRRRRGADPRETRSARPTRSGARPRSTPASSRSSSAARSRPRSRIAGSRSRKSRNASSRRKPRWRCGLTDVERKEQGLGDREVHVKAAPGRAPRIAEGCARGARAHLGAHRPRGAPATARALEGPHSPRACTRRSPDGGGGTSRRQTAGSGPHRRLAPARRREPHGRGDGLGGRAGI